MAADDPDDPDDVERAFIRAVHGGDRARVYRLLEDMWVYTPVVMRAPDDVVNAVVWRDGDRRYQRAYTSKDAATGFLARHSVNASPNYVSAMRFTHLLRGGPTQRAGIVINPDGDAEFRIEPAEFTKVTGRRWAELSYGGDGVPVVRRLSSKLAQVEWYVTGQDDVIRIVYLVVAKVRTTNGRPDYRELSRRSELLAEDLAKDLGPRPDGLRYEPHFEAARFVGVRVRADVEVAPDADQGFVRSRAPRALYALLNPVGDEAGNAGWPLGRTLDRATVREALSRVPGVADVRELRMSTVDPVTGEHRGDVDEVELGSDTTVYSLDHDVSVTPSRPAAGPGRRPARSRARLASIGVGIAVVPVVLGTVLQITDKASAPLWVIIGLIVLTGVATLVATVRSARTQRGPQPLSSEPAPGTLEVNDVKLERVSAGLMRADFRVTNTGGSTVSIHSVELESVAVEFEYLRLGVMEVSGVYDVDITTLQTEGASVTCDVAQQIAPGDVDRFVIQLKSEIPHVLTRLAVRPILDTNFGPVSAPLLELVPSRAD